MVRAALKQAVGMIRWSGDEALCGAVSSGDIFQFLVVLFLLFFFAHFFCAVIAIILGSALLYGIQYTVCRSRFMI